MFRPGIRLIFISISFVAAYASFIRQQEFWIAFLIVGLVLVYTHIRNGSIFLALQAYRKQDISLVRLHLNTIKQPQWLSQSSKSYYYFLSGLVAHSEDKFKQAIEDYKQAHDILKSVNLKSVLLINMTDVFLRLGQLENAKAAIESLKSLAYPESMKELILNTEAQIKELENKKADH